MLVGGVDGASGRLVPHLWQNRASSMKRLPHSHTSQVASFLAPFLEGGDPLEARLRSGDFGDFLALSRMLDRAVTLSRAFGSAEGGGGSSGCCGASSYAEARDE